MTGMCLLGSDRPALGAALGGELARWVIDGRHVGRTFDVKADATAWETDARRRSQLGAHAPAELPATH